MKSDRTRSYQLQSLVELGHLKIAPVRSTSPNFPYVYYTTRKGLKLVQESYESLGQSFTETATEEGRRGGLALQSLLHELFLTEFGLGILQSCEQRPELQCPMIERRYHLRDRQLRFGAGQNQQSVIPDAGILLKQTAPGNTDAVGDSRLLLHLVELDNGTMPLPRIAAKLKRYDQWRQSPESREYMSTVATMHGIPSTDVSVRFLFVCTDAIGRTERVNRRVRAISKTSLERSAYLRSRLWVTDMTSFGNTEENQLGASIWVRPREILRETGKRGNTSFDAPKGGKRSSLIRPASRGLSLMGDHRHEEDYKHDLIGRGDTFGEPVEAT